MNLLQPRVPHLQRVPWLEMLLSQKSSRLWPFLRLLLLFLATLVLPRLLSLRASHSFVLAACCRRRGVGIIWQIDMYFWNRSHQDGFTVAANQQWSSSRDGCRFPWVSKHDFQDSGVTTSSFHRFNARLRTVPLVFRSSAHLFCCHVRAKRPSSRADPNLLLLVVCTRLPHRRVRVGSEMACVESSRMMCFSSLAVCGIACTVMLLVVVTM